MTYFDELLHVGTVQEVGNLLEQFLSELKSKPPEQQKKELLVYSFLSKHIAARIRSHAREIANEGNWAVFGDSASLLSYLRNELPEFTTYEQTLREFQECSARFKTIQTSDDNAAFTEVELMKILDDLDELYGLYRYTKALDIDVTVSRLNFKVIDTNGVQIESSSCHTRDIDGSIPYYDIYLYDVYPSSNHYRALFTEIAKLLCTIAPVTNCKEVKSALGLKDDIPEREYGLIMTEIIATGMMSNSRYEEYNTSLDAITARTYKNWCKFTGMYFDILRGELL